MFLSPSSGYRSAGSIERDRVRANGTNYFDECHGLNSKEVVESIMMFSAAVCI